MNTLRIGRTSLSSSCRRRSIKIMSKWKIKSTRKSSSENSLKRNKKSSRINKRAIRKRQPETIMTWVATSRWTLVTSRQRKTTFKRRVTRPRTSTWMSHRVVAWPIRPQSITATNQHWSNHSRLRRQPNGWNRKSSWRWVTYARTRSRSTMQLSDSSWIVQASWTSLKDSLSTFRKTSTEWFEFRMPMQATHP